MLSDAMADSTSAADEQLEEKVGYTGRVVTEIDEDMV